VKFLRGCAVAVLCAFSSGCASTEDGLRRAEEPGYQAGYGDGCVTASEQDKSFSTKRARDDYQFESDRAYRAGWRQGYLSCGGNAGQQSDGGLILGRENEY
jgi:hypothetical protein